MKHKKNLIKNWSDNSIDINKIVQIPILSDNLMQSHILDG